METREQGGTLTDVDYTEDSYRNVSEYVHDPQAIAARDREEQEKAIRVGSQVAESMKTQGNMFMWAFMRDQLNQFKESYNNITPEELVRMQQFVVVISEMIELPGRLIEAGDIAKGAIVEADVSRERVGYGAHL